MSVMRNPNRLAVPAASWIHALPTSHRKLRPGQVKSPAYACVCMRKTTHLSSGLLIGMVRQCSPQPRPMSFVWLCHDLDSIPHVT